MKMYKWTLAALLPLAACAPPPGNEVVADNVVFEPDAEGDNGAANEAAPAAPNAVVPANDAAAAPAPAPPKAAPGEPYTARGQEPGWALRIDKGRIDYQGNYGEKLINVAAPAPQPIANGRRYVTDRLTVAITYKRCNDAMSGHGYEHEVKVTADGETFDGCGGPRRTDWDM